MSDKTPHWNDMYAMPVEQIPWEIPNPPKELIEAVATYARGGKTALDIGCGTGNYSFYLARHGYEVTGIDSAQKALDIATSRNTTLKLPVRFIRADVTDLSAILAGKTFDFVLDYGVLHHIAPENVKNYAKQFTKLLSNHGKLLVVCYSDQDEYGHGAPQATGKYGNEMFYRSRHEIENLYDELHEISYTETRIGKRQQHQAHSFVFEKGTK